MREIAFYMADCVSGTFIRIGLGRENGYLFSDQTDILTVKLGKYC